MLILRGWRQAGAVSVLALVFAPALPWGATVRAHAQLVASTPGAGSVVPEPPDELRLVFSEPLEEQVTSLDLVAGDGRVVLSRAGEIDSKDDYALIAAAPELDEGIYQVRWRTLSAADGHTAQGSFNFGVGDLGSSLPGATDSGLTHLETDPVRVAGRWLAYPGLLLAVGVPTFTTIVLRRAQMTRATVRLLAIALAVSALATLGVALTAASATGSIAEYLVGSRNGSLQLTRAAVVAAAAAALLLAPPRMALITAVVAGIVGIGLLVAAGHAAAQPTLVPVVVETVHVAGAAVWVGGIGCLLALLVRPWLLIDDGARPEMRALVPRFSALALVSIGLVGLTGVYAAWIHTASLLPVDTDYGRTLLLKSGFAIGAIALGGLNYLDGGRMRAWLGGIRARLGSEVSLVAAVLAISALLAYTSAGNEGRGIAIEPIPDAFGQTVFGLGMEIAPGRPGVNRIVVTTGEALATGSMSMEIVLDRLDTGTTARVPLRSQPTAGHAHTPGMTMDVAEGETEWVADAVVLPARSEWHTSVVLLSLAGDELTRQRFAFTVDDSGIEEGRAASFLDPVAAVAAVLLVGGALGLGLGLGGMPLPRCEPVASRIALVGGGATAVALGAAIGVSRLVG